MAFVTDLPATAMQRLLSLQKMLFATTLIFWQRLLSLLKKVFLVVDLAFQFPVGLSILSSPPSVVGELLFDYVRGLTTPRLVVVQPCPESNE